MALTSAWAERSVSSRWQQWQQRLLPSVEVAQGLVIGVTSLGSASHTLAGSSGMGSDTVSPKKGNWWKSIFSLLKTILHASDTPESEKEGQLQARCPHERHLNSLGLPRWRSG